MFRGPYDRQLHRDIDEPEWAEVVIYPATIPGERFLLGGSGWDDKSMPANISYVGHVYTLDHNATNPSARAVLNVTRDSMAGLGHSPPRRMFEAAGADIERRVFL